MAETISSGGTLIVSSGQTSNFLGVLSGGMLSVLPGGTVVDTAVQGTEVLSGGTDISGTLSSGARLTTSFGGVLSGTTIGIGADATVSSGGIASGTLVFGTETVSAGTAASGTVVSGTTGAILTTFGDLYVVGGAYSVSVEVATNGSMVVGNYYPPYTTPASAYATATTVDPGGALYIWNGGVASGTVLLSGHAGYYGAAGESVDGGTAIGTVVESGTGQSVYGSGATTTGTIILSGGSQDILDGGAAYNDVVAAGAGVYLGAVLAYTEANGITSSFAGILSGSGTLLQSGPGTLALGGVLDGFRGSLVIDGGTLELTSGDTTGNAPIEFAPGTAGILRIDGATGANNTISAFGTGDVLDLAGIAFAGTVAPVVSGNTVTVTEGSLSESVVLADAGLYSFDLRDDGSGGTAMQVACFCHGTLILTLGGEAPIETLAIGDMVITTCGAHRPIRWIGRRSYAGRFLLANPGVQPIRFRAGCLGGGLPRRDLLVSPEHALFLSGVLIPARHLGSVVN